jgi:SAM-dependent methyltransferase
MKLPAYDRMKELPLETYLSGDALYGDDFDNDETALWFEQEKEAYASLGAANRSSYQYVYHALNRYHGFSHLPNTQLADVLGLGSAWGDELLPLVGKAHRAIILDASQMFVGGQIEGLPIEYRQPNISGCIDLPDSSVDLVVCFGVLHHIPNVSFVIRELGRVLKPNGYLLLREPIVSMGDWRNVRSGLTKNERGIPLQILRDRLLDAGLNVRREALVDFPPLTRILAKLVRKDVFNSTFIVILDYFVCKLARWNLRYHARSPWQKFRPTSAFFVCCKSGGA